MHDFGCHGSPVEAQVLWLMKCESAWNNTPGILRNPLIFLFNWELWALLCGLRLSAKKADELRGEMSSLQNVSA